LAGQVAEKLRIILETIGLEYGWPIITKEIQPDHIHLFVSIPPSISVSEVVKKFKGISARKFHLGDWV
jgi:putative transposase